MFLLTFALLIISMLGIYTQVSAVEASRLLASQSTIGQEMVMWHGAAASIAANVVNPTEPPLAALVGCRLSGTAWVGAPSAAPALCVTGGSVTVPGPGKPAFV